MKKVLFVTHNGRFLVQFELNDIRILQELGYEVHCATNFEGETMRADAENTLKEHGVICHSIPIERSPLRLKENLNAYRALKSLLKKEHFAGVHCHTPMGGVVGRLAANATHTAPVLYTAHGFHFYKGCPLKNRLIYQTAETFLARYTDAQITINQEDYAAAQKFPLRGKAYYVPGIGVDVKKISSMQVDRATKRKELGIPEDAFAFLTVGELIPRKGHELLIRAFAKSNISGAQLLICGSGREKEHLTALIKELGISDRAHLLGFRNDIYELLKCADAFVFPSKQEGLPVALMEAMAAGLPCIASRIRGNVDLLPDSRYLFESSDESTLCQLMQNAVNGVQVDQECAQNKKALEQFDVKNVSECMRKVYTTVLEKSAV